MSKPLRQKVILELLSERSVGSQEDLQRALGRRGLQRFRVTFTTSAW
jgi:arginine repressor